MQIKPNCLANAKDSGRNNDSPKDISYFVPIPRNGKPLDGIHTNKLPQVNKSVNQKRTIPVLGIICIWLVVSCQIKVNVLICLYELG